MCIVKKCTGTVFPGLRSWSPRKSVYPGSTNAVFRLLKPFLPPKSFLSANLLEEPCHACRDCNDEARDQYVLAGADADRTVCAGLSAAAERRGGVEGFSGDRVRHGGFYRYLRAGRLGDGNADRGASLAFRTGTRCGLQGNDGCHCGGGGSGLRCNYAGSARSHGDGKS